MWSIASADPRVDSQSREETRRRSRRLDVEEEEEEEEEDDDETDMMLWRENDRKGQRHSDYNYQLDSMMKKNLSTSLFLPLSFFLSLSPACEHKLWVPFIFSWCMWNLTRSMSQLIIMPGHCCSISKSRTDEACFFPVQYAQNRHRNYFLISSYNEWNITVFQPSIRWCQVRSLTQQHPSMSHDSSLFYQKYDN